MLWSPFRLAPHQFLFSFFGGTQCGRKSRAGRCYGSISPHGWGEMASVLLRLARGWPLTPACIATNYRIAFGRIWIAPHPRHGEPQAARSTEGEERQITVWPLGGQGLAVG